MSKVLERVNPNYAAVVICAHCGSNRVDVAGWNSRTTARFRCAGCQHEALVEGFTIGRAMGESATACLPGALDDAALPELAALVRAEAERHAG